MLLCVSRSSIVPLFGDEDGCGRQWPLFEGNFWMVAECAALFVRYGPSRASECEHCFADSQRTLVEAYLSELIGWHEVAVSSK